MTGFARRQFLQFLAASPLPASLAGIRFALQQPGAPTAEGLITSPGQARIRTGF